MQNMRLAFACVPVGFELDIASGVLVLPRRRVPVSTTRVCQRAINALCFVIQ